MHEDHVSWRRRLGESVAAAYAADDAVAATAIAGSVARSWADRYSDIEVLVFWQRPPEHRQRVDAVVRSGGTIDVDWSHEEAAAQWRCAVIDGNGHIGELWPYEDDEWAEHFYVSGVHVGVSGFALATADAWIRALVDEAQPTDDAQMLAASLVNANDVTGAHQLEVWRRRLREFPDQLRNALVAQALEVDETWWNVDLLASRDDRPAFDLLLVSMAQRIIRCLLAVNRRYLPDPKPKWTRRLLGSLADAPPRICDRLDNVWGLPAQEAARLIADLFDETLDLVDATMPEFDVTGTRRFYANRRAVWDVPPPGVE